MLSASAQEHIGKCQATAMESVNDMVAHLVCEAALAAAYELWQESLVPEQAGEPSVVHARVQTLSSWLSTNPDGHTAVVVEIRISELDGFVSKKSNAYLRDAITFSIIRALGADRRSTEDLDSVAKQMCPHIFADTATERRSQLLNSLRKNLQRLVHVGMYLIRYNIPKSRRKNQRAATALNAAGQDLDSDTDDDVEVPPARTAEKVAEIPQVHTVERVVEVPQIHHAAGTEQPMHVQLDPVRDVAPAQIQQVTGMGPDMSAASQAMAQSAQLAYARDHALRIAYAVAPKTNLAAQIATAGLPPKPNLAAQIATAGLPPKPNRWNRRASSAKMA